MTFVPSGRLFPRQQVITPQSLCSVGAEIRSQGWALSGQAALGVANVALYFPFAIANTFVVKEVFWTNGNTVSGNIDVGVYDEAGTRLVSCGATAASGTVAHQSVDVTDTALPGPGRYYLAWHNTSTTHTAFLGTLSAAGVTDGFMESLGIMEESVATQLPATATFAAPTSLNVIPHFGILQHTLQ